MGEPLGIVAGNGAFPLALARAARAEGRTLVVVAHDGETDRAIEKLADSVTWVKVGQAGRVLEAFRAGHVREAVMLGGIDKKALLGGVRPDLRGLRLLAKVAMRGDDSLLRAVAKEFEAEGIRIVSSLRWLGELRAPEGVLGRHQPTPEEREDVAYGLSLARGLGTFDVGQTVVVKARMPVAVEAIEGTDACIARGGGLVKEGGAVVVKVVKPGQDERFDLPAAGSRTVDVCAKHRVRVLAVEAGGTILADRDEMIRRADRAGIVLMGVR